MTSARGDLLSHLTRVTRAVRKVLLALHVLHDERVIYRGEPYAYRMRRDHAVYVQSIANHNDLQARYSTSNIVNPLTHVAFHFGSTFIIDRYYVPIMSLTDLSL